MRITLRAVCGLLIILVWAMWWSFHDTARVETLPAYVTIGFLSLIGLLGLNFFKYEFQWASTIFVADGIHGSICRPEYVGKFAIFKLGEFRFSVAGSALTDFPSFGWSDVVVVPADSVRNVGTNYVAKVKPRPNVPIYNTPTEVMRVLKKYKYKLRKGIWFGVLTPEEEQCLDQDGKYNPSMVQRESKYLTGNFVLNLRHNLIHFDNNAVKDYLDMMKSTSPDNDSWWRGIVNAIGKLVRWFFALPWWVVSWTMIMAVLLILRWQKTLVDINWTFIGFSAWLCTLGLFALMSYPYRSNVMSSQFVSPNVKSSCTSPNVLPNSEWQYLEINKSNFEFSMSVGEKARVIYKPHEPQTQYIGKHIVTSIDVLPYTFADLCNLLYMMNDMGEEEFYEYVGGHYTQVSDDYDGNVETIGAYKYIWMPWMIKEDLDDIWNYVDFYRQDLENSTIYFGYAPVVNRQGEYFNLEEELKFTPILTPEEFERFNGGYEDDLTSFEESMYDTAGVILETFASNMNYNKRKIAGEKPVRQTYRPIEEGEVENG